MSLLAYYKLDGDVKDYSGNGYDGFNSGVTFVDGKVNSAGDFEANDNDYIDISSIPDSLGSGDFSYSVWVKFESFVSNSSYGSKRTSGGVGWRVQVGSSGNIEALILNSGTNTVLDGGSASLDTWYHVVLTKNGSTYTLYVNNTQVAQDTGDSDISNSDNFVIGRTDTSNSLTHDGLVDEARVFDHALSTAEIKELFQYRGIAEVEINTASYSLNLIDFYVAKASIYRTGELHLFLSDPDNTIGNTIKRWDEVKLYSEGTLRFTALIIDIDDGEGNSHTLSLYCKDYWEFMNRTPVTAEYTARPASYVINDIVTNNEYISARNIGTSKIDSTTDTNDHKFVGRAASDIIIDFCLQEDYIAYIDENKDMVFKSNIKDDTGVSLTYADGDIRSENFKRTGGEIVTAVRVRGKPGSPPNNKPVAAIYEDDELVDQYDKLPILEINKPELSTKRACYQHAKREIQRRNESRTRGMITVTMDFSLEVGKLVTLTIAHKNFSEQPFYILGAEHSFSDNETRLELVFYSRTSADMVDDIVRKTIKTEQYLSDDAVIFAKFKELNENVNISAYVDVDRRTYTGAVYGEFGYGDKYYGQTSGSWTSVVSNQQIKVMNQFLQDILSIITQIATVPNDLSASNVHIAIGSGSTTINYGDTSLENENYRLPMEAGYPQRISKGRADFRSIFGDADAITATISNVAILNNSSGGNLEVSGVLSSSISKAEDEEIRFTFRVQLTKTTFLTDNGVNLLIDQLIGADSNFLDNSNASIEVTTDGPSTYRDTMDTGFPAFETATKDQVVWQTTISTSEITSESLDGEVFTEVDLYNKTSSGTKVIDGTVGSTTFSNLQEMVLLILMKMVRA